MSKKKLSKNLNQQGYRIAAYVRVSTEEQAENPEGSIKNQEMRLREYVKLKNMMEPFGEIVQVYSDPGVSAKDMNRPSFQLLLKAIERHEIDLVLVTELSRFSRSTKDFANLQEFLEEHECKFMSLRENFDTSGAAGSMVLNLMASIAEFERKQTAERISQSFLARAKRGLYNGGSVPLGYIIDDETPGVLKINPEEAELVELIFHTFLRERTLAQTAKWLNQQGIRLPKQVRGGGSVRSKMIRFDSVYRILKNKSYIGIRVYKNKHKHEEVKALWKPIIDETTFARVQKILEANCYRRKTHKNKFPFTLSGLIQCKECHEMMSGASATSGSGKRIGYYEHLATRKKESGFHEKILQHKPRRIPAQKIEPLVWDEVKKFILTDDFSKMLLAKAQGLQGIDLKATRSKDLNQKIITLDRQVSVLAERIAKLPEEVNPDPLIKQLSELQADQVKFTKELKTVNDTESSSELVSFESLELFRNGFRDLVGQADVDHRVRSNIIRLIVHKIEVMQDGFEIHFNMGQSYFEQALGNKNPSATFFVPKNKKASGVLPPEAFKFYLDFLKIPKSQASRFSQCERSRRLTFGGRDLQKLTR